MERLQISETFYSLVAPSHPNEWEIEEVVEHLAQLPDQLSRRLLDHVPAVWPISHSLCYRYLDYGAKQIHLITPELLPEWIRQLLFHYEKGGLRESEAFMNNVQQFLSRQGSVSEVKLSDISVGMTHYIRGVSGQYLKIAEDGHVWTDTETIYLPAAIDLFPSAEENRLFYKFLVTYQWALIRLGIFRLFVEHASEHDNPAATHELRKQLTDSGDGVTLLKLYCFIKVCLLLKGELPGLWRRSSPLVLTRFEGRHGQLGSELAGIIGRLAGEDGVGERRGNTGRAGIDAAGCLDFIQAFSGADLNLDSAARQLILGELNFSKAEQVVVEQRVQDKKTFIEMLARILPPDLSGAAGEGALDDDIDPRDQEADGAVGVIAETLGKMVEKKERKTIRIDNVNVTVPDELIDLAGKVAADFGSVPVGYVQAASGLAGEGRTGDDPSTAGVDPNSPPGQQGYIYDEWDCRRNGYRRDWCTVVEEELSITRSNFISQTLVKHSGLRKRLRAQFELMRTSHRFIRRQRDGDDLDLDAITDAMGDRLAGKSASERLFVRLQRDERSITTLFLIDMSNSTSGWIGTFIKESLVLLCEAMENIGDQYGIYGFSGMKRSGCKLYHIKNLDEPYDEATRDRISAIGPKDYTRMAPAVRHLTSILEKSDSKTRLLMSLSDGKPEDYDGYNGVYAIEDTRKALLEARGKGVSPFCITIDKRAHDYLGHMFGSGNYIFINRIEHLPARMAQVYRTLTR